VILVWGGFEEGDKSFEAYIDITNSKDKSEFFSAVRKFRGFSATFTFITVILAREKIERRRYRVHNNRTNK